MTQLQGLCAVYYAVAGGTCVLRGVLCHAVVCLRPPNPHSVHDKGRSPVTHVPDGGPHAVPDMAPAALWH